MKLLQPGNRALATTSTFCADKRSALGVKCTEIITWMYIRFHINTTIIKKMPNIIEAEKLRRESKMENNSNVQNFWNGTFFTAEAARQHGFYILGGRSYFALPWIIVSQECPQLKSCGSPTKPLLDYTKLPGWSTRDNRRWTALIEENIGNGCTDQCYFQTHHRRFFFWFNAVQN